MRCKVLGYDKKELDYQHALNILRIESKKRNRKPDWELHPESGYQFVNDEIVQKPNSEHTRKESPSKPDKQSKAPREEA